MRSSRQTKWANSFIILKRLTEVSGLDAGDAGDVLDFTRQINGLRGLLLHDDDS
jgi:hypothetical protein